MDSIIRYCVYIYIIAILPEIVIDNRMLLPSHPLADIINEGIEIADALDFRITKDDTKMWFIACGKEEWRSQELDEKLTII